MAFVGSPSTTFRRCGSAASRSPFSRRAMPRLKWAPRLFGSRSQGFLEDLDRLGIVAARGERGAQVRVGPPVLRVELDGLLERGDGAGEVRLLRESDAEPVVGLGGARSDLHGSLEREKGAGELVLAPVREAERYMGAGIPRITLDGRLELAHGRGSRSRLLLLAGRRHSQGENEEGRAAREDSAIPHPSGSSRRSCNREVASSSSRSDFAISSCLSASSLRPVRARSRPSW